MCGFPECDRPMKSRGLCSGHYEQMRNGKSLSPLRALQMQRAEWLARGLMRCARCGKVKSIDQCWRAKCQCKDCARDIRRAYDTANPERARSVNRRNNLKKHGMTVDRYDALLLGQGSRCANPGCRSLIPGGRGFFHIDHDHACCPGPFSCGRCVTGLLCHSCNVGSGHFGDDPAKLEGMARYRRRSRLVGA